MSHVVKKSYGLSWKWKLFLVDLHCNTYIAYLVLFLNTKRYVLAFLYALPLFGFTVNIKCLLLD